MMLHPEEMRLLYSERERSRLAAERYALSQTVRRQRRNRRKQRSPRRRLPANSARRLDQPKPAREDVRPVQR